MKQGEKSETESKDANEADNAIKLQQDSEQEIGLNRNIDSSGEEFTFVKELFNIAFF